LVFLADTNSIHSPAQHVNHHQPIALLKRQGRGKQYLCRLPLIT
jgi:hypothetical protein